MVAKKRAKPAAKHALVQEKLTSLPSPDWGYWQQKDGLSIVQAALISMGINPFAGASKYLKNHRAARYTVLEHRCRELTRAYGKDPALPPRTTLPRLVPLLGALEYASRNGWLRKPYLQRKLEELRAAANKASPADSMQVLDATTVARPAEVPASGLPLGSPAAVHRVEATEMQGRSNKNILKVVGALLVLIEQQDLKTLKHSNGRINHSAVSKERRKNAREYSLEANTVADFSDSLVMHRLSEGRKLYRAIKDSDHAMTNPEADAVDDDSK